MSTPNCYLMAKFYSFINVSYELHMTAGVPQGEAPKNFPKLKLNKFLKNEKKKSPQLLDCWQNRCREIFPGNQQNAPRKGTNIGQSKRTNSLPE